MSGADGCPLRGQSQGLPTGGTGLAPAQPPLRAGLVPSASRWRQRPPVPARGHLPCPLLVSPGAQLRRLSRPRAGVQRPQAPGRRGLTLLDRRSLGCPARLDGETGGGGGGAGERNPAEGAGTLERGQAG